MKKNTLLMAILLTAVISTGAHAEQTRGFTEKTTAEIQSFFNIALSSPSASSTKDAEHEKIRMTREALVFHLSRLPKIESKMEVCKDGLGPKNAKCPKPFNASTTASTTKPRNDMKPPRFNNASTTGSTTPRMPRSSFLQDYFKNVTAQVMFMFGK